MKYTVLNLPTMERINAKPKKAGVAVSLFSGMGGGSIGLKLAGYEVRYANEFIPIARKTYRKNAPGTYCDGRDIRKVKPKDILDIAGCKPGEVDLLEMSPPCFPKDTMIYTKDGYKPIQSIVIGDYVLTHNRRFRQVTSTMVRRTGRLYELSTPGGLSVMATGEHPFYARLNTGGIWDISARLGKPQWKPLSELEVGTFVATTYDPREVNYVWNGIRTNEKYHPKTKDVVYSKWENTLPVHRLDFWWLVGRWVGDGWLRYSYSEIKAGHTAKRRRAAVYIAADKTSSKEVKEITLRLKSCGFTYGIGEHRTAYKVGFGNRELCEFLLNFGRGAANKCIPGFVLALPKRKLEAFCQGYLSADGSVVERVHKFSTVSKELALGMSMVLQKLYHVHVNLKKTEQHPTASVIEGRKINCRPIFVGTWRLDESPKKMCVRDGSFLWVPARTIQSRAKTCAVYNLSVAQDESYIADGYVVHNCKVFSAAQARNRGKNMGQVINYSENVKQRVDDLFFEGCRILKGVKPRAFIAENVKGLLADANKPIFKEVYRALERCGYRVKAAVLNGTNFGVPQARERLIFIGIRKDLDIEPQFPDISEHQPVYVQDALPHVVKIKTGRKFVNANRNFTSTITAADSAISFTAQFSAGGFCELADGTIRKFTIKELKLLSSVPQDFKLLGTFKQRWERLGRIHLPLQVYYLAATLKKQLRVSSTT